MVIGIELELTIFSLNRIVQNLKLKRESIFNIFWETHLNKRGVIAFSLLICLALIIGGLVCWKLMTSWVWKKPELEWCIERLEDEGYIIEERPLTEFHVNSVLEVHWFSDFRGIAKQENVSYVYIDREMGALYFLSEPLGGGTEGNVFYYNRED